MARKLASGSACPRLRAGCLRLAQGRRKSKTRAGVRRGLKTCDDGYMPVICPTCQILFGSLSNLQAQRQLGLLFNASGVVQSLQISDIFIEKRNRRSR